MGGCLYRSALSTIVRRIRPALGGASMTTTTMKTKLGYWINDADNHFNEPPDCFERHIDSEHADLAIRSVTGPDGEQIQLFAGKPSKFHSQQVTMSEEEV